MSNKLIEIDEKVLANLSQLQLPYRTIAAVLGISEKTLVMRYRDFIDANRERSVANLTKLVWDEALSKRKEYAIKMLSQRYLGMADKVQHSVNFEHLNKLTPEELRDLADSAMEEIKRIDENTTDID